MRARYPEIEGYVERDGVKVGYEVYGAGDTTVVFFPIDMIVHSRAWKAQIPYLARFYRVVVIDPRGNGRSDRPTDPMAYRGEEYVADTIAVMDEVGVDRAVLVGICTSAWYAATLAADHPERVLGLFAIGPWLAFVTPPHPIRGDSPENFAEVLPAYEGWNKMNKHYWLQDWRGFVEFFFDQLLPEPHSTKQWEDAVGFALDTDGPTQVAESDAPMRFDSAEGFEGLLRSVSCPVLVLHGDEDRCQPRRRAEIFAE
ncbi:MAG: hypothetical protein QOJ90_943, partial [Actinomycetota bacterium]|nr:hypothetical protein [Actinomycetota bacterium]